MNTKPQNHKLLNIDKNSKTVLGQKYGYKTAILYLSPHKLAYTIFKEDKKRFTKHFNHRYKQNVTIKQLELLLKNINVCPFAKTCIEECLNTSGRGQMDIVQFGRAVKTAFYYFDKVQFMQSIEKELHNLFMLSLKQGFKTACRLNGTSDLHFAKFYEFYKSYYKNDLVFYNYSKNLALKSNKYHDVTTSIQNFKAYQYWLANSHNNGVIVTKLGIKDDILNHEIFKGIKFINGNEHDLRFLDKKTTKKQKYLVVLKGKGKAAKSDSDFIINNWLEVK